MIESVFCLFSSFFFFFKYGRHYFQNGLKGYLSKATNGAMEIIKVEKDNNMSISLVQMWI